MSSEKINEKNIEEIIARAYELTGTKNNAQLAKKMGITNGSFNNRKKRGTAHELIFDWAMKVGYDLNYLFYGVKKEEAEIENEVLLKIQEWLNDTGKINKDFKIWFKVQFDTKFPEFIEWKKRKEERQGKDNLSGFSNVA